MPPPPRESRARYVVAADEIVRPLLPGYLARRREDVQRIRACVTAGDFATLRVIGHDLKGSGLAYGIAPVSEIGARLEEAAAAGDGARSLQWSSELEAVLDSITIA